MQCAVMQIAAISAAAIMHSIRSCVPASSPAHSLLLLLLLQVRDPPAGVFSAETMLRNMGVPLPWSLTQPLQQGHDAAGHSNDPRFQVRVRGGRGQ
jgi:hypothetical protein